MIVADVMQGTDDWHALRAGVFTASRADALLAKGKGGAPSVTRQNLLVEIAIERLTGRPAGNGYTSAAMERGQELEAEAREAYSFETGHPVRLGGFIFLDDQRRAGCSPDGLIGDDGLVEIKCPAVHARHFDALIRDSHVTEYMRQVQFQLLVTGRAWCDLVSYHPDFPEARALKIARVLPDAEMHAQYREQLAIAEEEVAAIFAELEAA